MENERSEIPVDTVEIEPNIVVYPNDSDAGFHVVYGHGKKVVAAPGKKVCIRTPASRSEQHAWVEDVEPDRSRARARTVAELLESLSAHLRKFLEEIVEKEPRFDDGEEGKFVVRAGVDGYDDDDAPHVTLVVRTSIERAL